MIRSETDEPHSRKGAQHRRDADQALARPRRGRGERGDRRRLPRPHARPARPPRPARPEGRGRAATSRPAPTTRSRTSASSSARRSTRRSATAPGSAATARPWCRWTSRWPSARSTSPGARYCVFDADLPATSIAGFDTELAEEFFRAVANSAKLTLHICGPLRDQRPPHDRGLLQGLRPGPARRRLDRPGGERRALDQGDAERVTRRGSRSSTTGWATCARSRRRSSTSASTATITADPDAVRAADGVILPGVGAFPRAMERIRELGLDELIAERREAGVPILGICLGLQLLFDSTTELGGADGPRPARGAGRRARRRGPQGPAHRLVAGALGARVAR